MSRFFIAPLASLLALSACVNTDTINGPVEMPLTVIATFEGNLPTAQFSLWTPGASVPERILTDRTVEGDATPGTRMIIRYVPQSGSQAKLTGVGAVTNLTPQLIEGVPQGWDVDAVWVESVSASGPYVDMRMRLPYTEEPRMFAIAVDSRTLNADTVCAVLAHRLPEEVNPDATFSRRYYASASLADLWSVTEAKVLAITINNANLTNHKTFIINKP